MDLKAIVLDLDGTLLNSEKIVSPGTKQKLIEAQEKGIKVILASGRPTLAMMQIAEELELDKYEGYVVSYNGSSVYDAKTKKIVFQQLISEELSKDILNHVGQYDVVPMVVIEDCIYVTDAFFDIDYPLPGGYKMVVEYESRMAPFKVTEVDDFNVVVDRPLNKILLAGRPDYLAKNWEALSAPFLGQATSVFSTPFYFEFTDVGVDKAYALHEFLPKLGIKPENVIAFGDGQNDRSIIEYAGVGVAMANAVPEILKLADKVTKSNDEDGIVEMLNRFF